MYSATVDVQCVARHIQLFAQWATLRTVPRSLSAHFICVMVFPLCSVGFCIFVALTSTFRQVGREHVSPLQNVVSPARATIRRRRGNTFTSCNPFRGWRCTVWLISLRRNINRVSLLQQIRYFISFATVHRRRPSVLSYLHFELHNNSVLVRLLVLPARYVSVPSSLTSLSRFFHSEARFTSFSVNSRHIPWLLGCLVVTGCVSVRIGLANRGEDGGK